MAETKKTNEIQKVTQHGTINFASDVIAVIAGLATSEVKGIAGMSGTSISELLGRKNLTKGVKVAVLDDKVSLEVNVVVIYGVKLQDVAAQVQTNVRKAIEDSGSVDEVEFVVREFKTTMEAIAASCPVKSFTDVSTNAWYHGAVDYVVLAGLMEGRGNGEFAPEAKLTRAELVIVLYRMAGKPSVEGLDNPFTDVGDDIWYTDAIIWAYHAGVVEGMSETTFAPNLSITREQAATILYRYSGAEAVEEDALKNYTDAGAVGHALRVQTALNVHIHLADVQAVFKPVDECDQRGGFSASRRGHKV